MNSALETTFMADEPQGIKDTRIIIRADRAYIERVQRVADERFGGNRSELSRRAIDQLVERIERELAEREPESRVAA